MTASNLLPTRKAAKVTDDDGKGEVDAAFRSLYSQIGAWAHALARAAAWPRRHLCAPLSTRRCTKSTDPTASTASTLSTTRLSGVQLLRSRKQWKEFIGENSVRGLPSPTTSVKTAMAKLIADSEDVAAPAFADL